jgi:Fur family zinc uptake transcriptional regulator
MAVLDERLDLADQVCRHHGARLTETRRDVLALILAAPEPLGAYALLEQLRGQGRKTGLAPTTVYRALEFLLAQGLVHRIERLNAYVGCVDIAPHGPASEGPASHGAELHGPASQGPASHSAQPHSHSAQFLICRVCGSVRELDDPSVTQALAAAAARLGFHTARSTIELDGTCAACAGRTAGTAS